MKKVIIAIVIILSVAVAGGLLYLGIKALDRLDQGIDVPVPDLFDLVSDNLSGGNGNTGGQNSNAGNPAGVQTGSDQNGSNKTETGDDTAGNDKLPGNPRAQGTKTIETVNSFDYFTDSVTQVTDTQFTEEELKEAIESFGSTYTGTPGMPVGEYKEAMEYKWVDLTEYGIEPEHIDFSITEKYRYEKLEEFLRILSRYEGVTLFDIGRSTAGRTMYALEIDVPSDKPKQTVMLTGTVHARETAGTTFLFKELIDL
ncbi:MAG: hypothetical protein K6E62_10380, partial [Lachnospiraceae bacterium]|nr:hypothetical protein [Lachnospiraceae bacterium]